MSQENVEIVRRYFAAVGRALDAYWENPRSAAAAMRIDDLTVVQREVFSYIHADVEWRNALGLSFNGRLDFATGVDHLLEATSAYSIAVKEVTDLGGDQVLAVIQATMKGKGSDIEASQTVFSLMTLRERMIVRAEEYLDRAEALKAVALSE